LGLGGGFADKTARSNQEEVFWRYSRASWGENGLETGQGPIFSPASPLRVGGRWNS
jgi:hypothetical protein